MRKAKGRGGLDPRRKKAPPRLSLVASVYWCGSRTQKRLLLGATTTTAAARATILVFLAGAFAAAALQLVGKIFSLPPSAAPENCIFRFERYLLLGSQKREIETYPSLVRAKRKYKNFGTVQSWVPFAL